MASDLFNRDSVIAGGQTLIEPARLHNLEAPRFVHLDLSKNRDSTGLAIGHVVRYINIDRGNTKETAPEIFIDAVLQIRPPRHGEIEFSWVRSIIYGLKSVVNITHIRTDGFESTDTLQEFSRHGYNVGLLSVDRTLAPYEFFKDTLADSRIHLPKSAVLSKEARTVQLDLRKGKVDHTPRGSKDVLDAVVGVTYALSKSIALQIEHDVADRMAPQLGSSVTSWGRRTELDQFMPGNDPFLTAMNHGCIWPDA